MIPFHDEVSESHRIEFDFARETLDPGWAQHQGAAHAIDKLNNRASLKKSPQGQAAWFHREARPRREAGYRESGEVHRPSHRSADLKIAVGPDEQSGLVCGGPEIKNLLDGRAFAWKSGDSQGGGKAQIN